MQSTGEVSFSFPMQINRERFSFFFSIISFGGALIALPIVTIGFLFLSPHVPIFTIDSFSISNLNASSPQISATFNLHFTVANLNSRFHARYEDVQARVYCGDSLIAQNQLPPLDQGLKSKSGLEARVFAVSSYIGSDLAGDLDDRRKKNGSVRFDAQVRAALRFKAVEGWWSWFASQAAIRVFCDLLPVKMNADGSGTLSGGPIRCVLGKIAK